MNPQKLYLLMEVSVAIIVLGVLWLILRPKEEASQFQVREADRRDRVPGSKSGESLADAKFQPRPQPLQLPGIRLDVPPHELLGVPAHAGSADIQKAFREKMKVYHPDRIGRPGSREWNDAQKIAQALQAARDHLLKKRPRS